MSRRRVQRSGRRARVASGVLPDDLYSYYTAEPRRLREPPPTNAVQTQRIIDDWPGDIPVTEAEVDVFERYFGDVLDRLFGVIDPDRQNDALHELTSDVNNRP